MPNKFGENRKKHYLCSHKQVMYMSKSKQLYIVIVLSMISAAALVSCRNPQHREIGGSHADSVIFAAGSVKQYERMLELTDSFEMSGDISPLDANRWRGVYYYRQGQYRMAEICYRKALECKVKSDQDRLSYNKVARRLSELLLVRGDYEGSLQVAIPAVKKMDESGIGSDIDYAILLNNIGCCQLNLGQDKEANESFLTARGHYANRWQSDSTGRGIQEAVSIPVMAKCRIGHIAEAQILQAIEIDYIDESEVLSPADNIYHIDKTKFDVPFVCGAKNLGEALRRIAEGATMIRTKGEPGTGDVVQAVSHMRLM